MEAVHHHLHQNHLAWVPRSLRRWQRLSLSRETRQAARKSHWHQPESMRSQARATNQAILTRSTSLERSKWWKKSSLWGKSTRPRRFKSSLKSCCPSLTSFIRTKRATSKSMTRPTTLSSSASRVQSTRYGSTFQMIRAATSSGTGASTRCTLLTSTSTLECCLGGSLGTLLSFDYLRI